MRFPILVFALLMSASASGAQTPAHDPSERLAAVLPEAVKARVLARIAEARARELPAQALEHRALEMLAKGADGPAVERGVVRHADAMMRATDALSRGRTGAPHADEVTAGAEAIMRGIDGPAISGLASSAPSGRSLAVPLYALSGLVARGLPRDEAISRVRERLAARASDEQLLADVSTLAPRAPTLAGRPAVMGTELSAMRRPPVGKGTGRGRTTPP